MAPFESKPFSGLRILVLEDELIVSLSIVDMIADFGGTIVGPFYTVETALVGAASAFFDAAILDLNICGRSSGPVIALLESRGVPFVLVTGYGVGSGPELHPGWRVCRKPFREEDFVRAITNEIAAADRY